MLTTYDDIDRLTPWDGWNAEQIRELRLLLHTSLESYLVVKGRMGEAVLCDQIQVLLTWELFPGLAARYEVELAEELYVEGPSTAFGLTLGRMLGNDLKLGFQDMIMAFVQSNSARNFIMLYREFISVGELKLADIV